jgi:F-type H+-transporting ATPase subunit delta
VADNNTVARPYAQAIFEVAQENGTLDELSASLSAASDLLGDGQVVAFLGQPSLNDDQRLEFLQGLFAEAAGRGSVFAGGSQHGTNFLKLLLENGRVAVLPEISAQFEALKAKVENSIDAVITAAAPLSAAQEKAIASSLAEKLGRDVRISTEVNENLIGGAVIRAGDVVIDGSLRARLEGLANALTK